MRIKVFTSGEGGWLEESVNKWIEENEKTVVITSIQSAMGGHKNSSVGMVTIVYEQSESFLKEVKDAKG